MLVDNQRPQQPFQLPTNISSFEDFFKLDLFPSEPSRSPSPHSLPLLSPASPDGNPVSIASQDPESIFNIYLEEDYTKDPFGSSSYDFFTSLSSLGASSSSTSPASATSPHFSIDPLLVGTPSTSHTQSEFGDVEEDESKLEEEDMEDKDIVPEITPVKAGGRGRHRKGTVLSGGVVKSPPSSQRILNKDKENNGPKRTTISTVVATGSLKDDLPDDWRPTPEEYKRMSSKEKRQLRNKISARNFRVRRKG